MTMSTTTTRPTLTADTALLIRPGDLRALAALRQLARENGARVQRGAIFLAGARRAAWLAFSPDGRLLAAVLIGDDGAASLTSSTERAIQAAQSAGRRDSKPISQQQLARLSAIRTRLEASRSGDTVDAALRELARMTLNALSAAPRTPQRTSEPLPQLSTPERRRADDAALYVINRRGRRAR